MVKIIVNTTKARNLFSVFIADVNECCVGTFCHINSTCSDFLGGFTCSCNDGFTGNGTHCEGTDLSFNIHFT